MTQEECKAFTSLEQSRELAEILPVESADFHFSANQSPQGYLEKPIWGNPEYADYSAFPCWSLAALLEVLPVSCDDGQHCFALINSNPNGDTIWLCCYEDDYGNLLNDCYADNPIDACYEMILKLDEQKLL